MILENKEQFETTLKDSKTTIVDFFATWCGPCRMLAPIFGEVGNEKASEANFLKVNVDDFDDLAAKYNVSSIPTIIVFKNGEEVHRVSGFQDKAKLINLVDSYK